MKELMAKKKMKFPSKLLLRPKGCSAVGALLRKATALEEVNLESTGMTLVALQALVQEAPEELSLKEIGFGNNPKLLAEREGGSAMGAFLRKAAARTVQALWDAIRHAIDAVTPQDAKSYFIACGYEPE